MHTYIAAHGLTFFNGLLTVNTDIWTTQARLAKKLNVSGNRVNNRVTRGMAAGTIITYYIEELGIRLIPNVNNINELGGSKKKTKKK